MPKDILLPLPAYPHAPSAAALGAALDAAAALEAHVTVLVCEAVPSLPVLRHPYPPSLLDAHAARQEAARQAGRDLLAAAGKEAKGRKLGFDGRIAELSHAGTGPVVELALTRNLSLLPWLAGDERWNDLAQALIFESGRPVLVLPAAPARPFRLDNVVVAWDWSRAASRALEDALPLLHKARRVRVVTVKDGSERTDEAAAAELAQHFARNGIRVAIEEIDPAGRSAGKALEAAAADDDLLIMGAFGHSRLRDFFLGGATRHMLENPKLPVLLSH